MKRKILALLAVAALVMSLAACGNGAKKDDSLEDTPKIEDGDATNPEPEEANLSNEPPAGDITYNVDWDKCLEDLKESVLNPEFFPFANDVYVIVDEEKEQITFSAVVGDATDPSVALDYADTIVRQYNLMANMQDNNIALGSKDYYGGLYDKYDFLIGVAPQSKTEDSDQWFVFDASVAGAHQALELQKEYR